MMFTILNDRTQSLVCNDCLDDERLEQSYAECSVGTCDECGHTDLGSVSGNGAGLLVICFSDSRGADWTLRHGIPNATLVCTNDDHGLRALEGRMAAPGHIMLLPEAERGSHFGEVENRMRMVTTGIIKNVKITANMGNLSQQIKAQTVNMHNLAAHTHGVSAGFQHYQNLIYGFDPAAKTGTGLVAITGVTS
jgi:hypothetical protein